MFYSLIYKISWITYDLLIDNYADFSVPLCVHRQAYAITLAS